MHGGVALLRPPLDRPCNLSRPCFQQAHAYSSRCPRHPPLLPNAAAPLLTRCATAHLGPGLFSSLGRRKLGRGGGSRLRRTLRERTRTTLECTAADTL